MIKYKELAGLAPGDPWCVADIDPYSQNRAQGWAAQFCVAVGNENNVRATALFDLIRSPQQASENLAALFRMAGELAKEHYARESR